MMRLTYRFDVGKAPNGSNCGLTGMERPLNALRVQFGRLARVGDFIYDFRLSRAAANSGSTMVWPRSGPVETMPIFAPLSRS